jgi:hypothetical protein
MLIEALRDATLSPAAIDVCPALPGDVDRHRLLIYLRVAGHPPVDQIVAELRGGTSGTSLEVREVGFFETELPRAIPPELPWVVLCRRALCDAATGMPRSSTC